MKNSRLFSVKAIALLVALIMVMALTVSVFATTSDPTPFSSGGGDPAPVYTITFLADGEEISVQRFSKLTDTIQEPGVPYKSGYNAKWPQYTLKLQNMIVEAIYSPKTYPLTFDANGGEGTMSNQILTWDKKQALTPNTFARDGYYFAGWNTKADGSGDSYSDGQTVSNLSLVGGALLYAQWTEIPPVIHTATFTADGVTVAVSLFEEGATELNGIPAIPEKEGYTGAWSAYTLGTTDITIVATYTANTYEIVFDANGGTGATAAVKATYDESIALTANGFSSDGKEFVGWNTKADGTGASYADGASVKNLATDGEVTLFAQWKDEETTTSETTTVETTTVATETTEAPAEKNNTGLIIGIVVAAVVAIAGGVAGFLVYQKKKNS